MSLTSPFTHCPLNRHQNKYRYNKYTGVLFISLNICTVSLASSPLHFLFTNLNSRSTIDFFIGTSAVTLWLDLCVDFLSKPSDPPIYRRLFYRLLPSPFQVLSFLPLIYSLHLFQRFCFLILRFEVESCTWMDRWLHSYISVFPSNSSIFSQYMSPFFPVKSDKWRRCHPLLVQCGNRKFWFHNENNQQSSKKSFGFWTIRKM